MQKSQKTHREKCDFLKKSLEKVLKIKYNISLPLEENVDNDVYKIYMRDI